MTVDVVTPMVDDPETFGAIAAANSISDVYAMGGVPEVALSIVGFPTGALDISELRAILAGMARICVAARCAIIGGHTIVDPEPKAGLSVTGSVDPTHVWSHRFAKAGQRIVLTKPIGTGVVIQGMKTRTIEATDAKLAIDEMQRLNAVARDLGSSAGATAATDVTGFGLLGHLRHMVEASGVSATLSAASVPYFPHALTLAEKGIVPGGSKKNVDYVAKAVTYGDAVGAPHRALLADAQTSGGLLLTVPSANAARLVRELVDSGHTAADIGEIAPRVSDVGAPSIRVVA